MLNLFGGDEAVTSGSIRQHHRHRVVGPLAHPSVRQPAPGQPIARIPQPRGRPLDEPEVEETWQQWVNNALDKLPALRVCLLVAIIVCYVVGTCLGLRLNPIHSIQKYASSLETKPVQTIEKVAPSLKPEQFQSISVRHDPESPQHQQHYWNFALTNPPAGDCYLTPVYTDKYGYKWAHVAHEYPCSTTSQLGFEIPDLQADKADGRFQQRNEDDEDGSARPIQVDLYAFTRSQWDKWQNQVINPGPKPDPQMIDVTARLVRVNIEGDPLNTSYYWLRQGDFMVRFTNVKHLWLPERHDVFPTQQIKDQTPQFMMSEN